LLRPAAFKKGNARIPIMLELQYPYCITVTANTVSKGVYYVIS